MEENICLLIMGLIFTLQIKIQEKISIYVKLTTEENPTYEGKME